MKFLLFFALFFVCLARFELFDYNPVADPKQIIISNNARFTILTDYVIRMEYNTKGKFVDDATLAFVNRNTPIPSFKNTTQGLILTIQTSALTLTYQIGTTFNEQTLNITIQGAKVNAYRFGDVDYGNLLGTIRSLDELGVTPLNCTVNAAITVHDESLHCAWGLISKFGWTTIDDSDNYLLDGTTGWWTTENPNQVDTYFFGHGNKYLQALQDYTLIGGKIAMPPRASNGIYWSRWYNMNDQDVFDLVDDYSNRGIPLDCYILDMDWHTKQGWGGYSFDKSLFPLAQAVMPLLQSRGILTSGNLHDDDGVRPNEDQYVPFCKALGVDPSLNQTINFAIVNEKYALALEDQVLKPLEDQGFGDFWWIDWQQGGAQGGCQGLKQNPTIWLNRLRATDHIRRGSNKRGMILSRWGGLGNHRYQVGFSGDVDTVQWQTLAYQPYFSLTASNVLFGFWSHDTVGPMRGNGPYDYELYARWVQWSAFSGVMRSHDRGMAAGVCAQQDPPTCSIDKIWNIPTPYFEAARSALQNRHTLLPYLYNAQRASFDTGVSLMRPLYYYWPDEPSAYLADEYGNYPQYMLGDSIMVVPVVSQGYNNDTLARQTFWFPPGTWVDLLTGNVHAVGKGGDVVTRAYDISEVPRFVKAGAIIPRIPLQIGNTVGRAQQQYSTIEYTLYLAPGVTSGSTTLYEDDASTTDYATASAFYNTAVTFQRSDDSISINVGAPVGTGYSQFPKQRNYFFRYTGSPPQSVVLNRNTTFSYSAVGGANTWRFDGKNMEVVIQTDLLDTLTAFTIVSKAADTSFESAMYGIKGMLARANLAKQTLDTSFSTPGSQIVQPAKLSSVASSGVSFSYLAGTNLKGFTQQVLALSNLYQDAVSEILGIEPQGSFPDNALVQWYNSDRQDNCLCSHNACNQIQAQSGYEFVRIEGYVPSSSSQFAAPLLDFYNSDVGDNLATTNPLLLPGYSPAIFTDGAVFSKQVKGTVPLQTYYSAQRHDWLTVSSQDGIIYLFVMILLFAKNYRSRDCLCWLILLWPTD